MNTSYVIFLCCVIVLLWNTVDGAALTRRQMQQRLRCSTCIEALTHVENQIEELLVKSNFTKPTKFRLDEKNNPAEHIPYARTEESLYKIFDLTRDGFKKDYGYFEMTSNMWKLQSIKSNSEDSARNTTTEQSDISVNDTDIASSLNTNDTDPLQHVVKSDIATKTIAQVVQDFFEYDADIISHLRSSSSELDSTLQRVCVDMLKWCPTWPVQWGEVKPQEVAETKDVTQKQQTNASKPATDTSNKTKTATKPNKTKTKSVDAIQAAREIKKRHVEQAQSTTNKVNDEL